MVITQIRKYSTGFTQSDLYFDNDQRRFCYVLEDIGRAWGEKVPGETCIPESTYYVSITRSNRWQKDMLILHNFPKYTIRRGGIRFTGVRPHGGNSVEDTEGCPILAYNSDNMGRVWTRASDDMFDKVKAAKDKGHQVLWVISSMGGYNNEHYGVGEG